MILERLRFKKFGIKFRASKNNPLEKGLIFPEKEGIYSSVGRIKSSVYPSTEDFNEKSEHIHKQLRT